MRILVMGAGVIGSVYAARLLEAGHTVTVCARGRRLAQLRDGGLILQDAETGRRTAHQVGAVATPDGVACELVLVAVRRDQMVGTVPLLANMDADVMFFGNAAGLTETLAGAIGKRTLFGFPAADGVREDAVVRFVLIGAQKTMVADSDRRRSAGFAALPRCSSLPGFRRLSAPIPRGG
jgi:2-dehydropantoate 2-reductase